MKQRPFTFSISVTEGTLSEYDNHIVRRLSAMKGQFLDEQAYTAILSQDPVLYEVYEIKRPESLSAPPDFKRHGKRIVSSTSQTQRVSHVGEIPH